ncbi:MAG: S16 family serine protease, partial [bacterium]
MPGRVIKGLKECGSNNPVMMLDEIDKLGRDFRGDPSSALLEVLDPEQNNSFVDNYLDLPFDLSNVMFITTANQLDPIPPALLDRMEVLRLPGYTLSEKVQIAKRYLVPAQIEGNGLDSKRLRFSDKALERMIESYTREAGVRNLERQVGNICRKVARKVAENKTGRVTVKPGNLAEYLGAPSHHAEMAQRLGQPGVAIGLAWTPVGGEILFVEAASLPGDGQLTLTGQVGEVMKESAMAALTFIKSKAGGLNLAVPDLNKINLHVHVPAGAVPKDGPSAGVTMCAALASLLMERPVRDYVGMTGEITLKGNVLPVGGIKEKLLAAARAGLREVYLPRRNEHDLDDVPEEVKKKLRLHLVSKVEELLPAVL